MIEFTGRVSDFLKIGVAAAARGDIDAVRRILKAKPDWIHRRGSHGRTMLWEACHRGKLEMVKYLVCREADIDVCGSHYTPYFVDISCYCIARFKRRNDVADFLQGEGAKQDIHTAAYLGQRDQVADYLKRNPKLRDFGHPQSGMAEPNDEGIEYVEVPAPWATPLCYALRGGNVDTVRLLIEAKARIKGFDEKMFTAADEQPELVEMLLENGADPAFSPQALPTNRALFNVVSRFGVELQQEYLDEELVYLCRGDRGGNPGEVEELLKAGADVNHQDHKGKTALHRAARAGFVETAKLLLDNGASVGLPDQLGETPLFEAVRSTIKDGEKCLRTIQVLLEAGADPALANERGTTPLDIARQIKRAERSRFVSALER